MQRALLCIVFSFVSALGASYAQEPSRPATQPTTQATGAAVPPAQFALLIGKPNHVLLDVRTPEEYAAGHLAGATLIDFYAPDFEQKIRQLPRDKAYLIYCRSGRRSHLACVQMEQLGFSNLVDLQGGIQAWQLAGKPTEVAKP